jgi:hypothetical protein
MNQIAHVIKTFTHAPKQAISLAAVLVIATLPIAARAGVPLPLRSLACVVLSPQVSRFVIRFTQTKGKIKIISVTDPQHVLHPGGGIAVYDGTMRGGAMVVTKSTIQGERSGKWSGKATASGFEFGLKAKDGFASIILTEDAAKPGTYQAKWNAATLAQGHIYIADDGVAGCSDAPATEAGG